MSLGTDTAVTAATSAGGPGSTGPGADWGSGGGRTSPRKDRQVRENAWRRAHYEDLLARWNMLHSAAKSELNLSKKYGPGEKTSMLFGARQGVYTPENLARGHTIPPNVLAALVQLQTDYAGLRSAKTDVKAARQDRKNDPEAFQQAMQQLQQVKHTTRAAEKRGMTQAEYQQWLSGRQ